MKVWIVLQGIYYEGWLDPKADCVFDSRQKAEEYRDKFLERCKPDYMEIFELEVQK